MNLQPLKLKPHKKSFMLSAWIWAWALLLAAAIALLAGSPLVAAALGAIAFAIVWRKNVKWNKEEYIFEDKKLVVHTWTPFSEDSIQVSYDKITQVVMVMPYLRHLLFKTGDIGVFTAWTGWAAVVLSDLPNPEQVYDLLRQRMQQAWFRLKKDKLVLAQKPHILGVLGEVGAQVLGGLISAAILIFLFLGDLSEDWNWQQAMEKIKSSTSLKILISVVALIFLGLIIGKIIITYLDLKRRNYLVYTDTIEYTEWFLTKVFSFIPMEMVSDVENTQSFFSRILGLHDIVISSPGVSTQVIFKNMPEGEKMIATIKYLKDQITPTSAEETADEKVSESSEVVDFKDKTEEPLDFDKQFTAHLKMDKVKTAIDSLVRWPFFLIGLVVNLVKAYATDYYIKPTTIEKRFSLFWTKYQSFTIPKITSVVFRQSLLDRRLGTANIIFWSIWGIYPIVFRNVKLTPELKQKILAKLGIRIDKQMEPVYQLEPRFNLADFAKAYFWLTFLILGLVVLVMFWMGIVKGGLVSAILFGIPLGLIFGYLKLFYSPKKYERKIFNNFVKAKEGILYIVEQYALTRHIKGVGSYHYPLTSTWAITLNIAWEVDLSQVDPAKKKRNKFMIVSNAIRGGYIPDVFGWHEKIDELLNWGKLDTEELLKTKQDLANTIVPAALAMIVVLVFLGLDFEVTSPQQLKARNIFLASMAGLVGLILITWSIIIYKKYWSVQKDRVVAWGGVFYPWKYSILHKKIDFIRAYQWFLNKIFKNGNVAIYTQWTASEDMVIKDTKDYKEVYKLLDSLIK